MFGTRSIRRTSAVILGVIALTASSVLPYMAFHTHDIAPGDTLFSIANRYGVSVEILARINGIDDPNLIYAGQRLSISSSATPADASSGEQSNQVRETYVVQPGDTLWSIASRFGITVAQLVEANRDSVPDQNLIYPGQELIIPGGVGGSGSAGDTPPPQPDPAPATGDIETLLTQTANAYGLDPNLVKAVAWQESGWNQNAVSSAGALGVMQVMPATGGWISEQLVGRPLDIGGSASENILAGVVYLEWLIRYTGSEDQALASYYQGPGSVSQRGWYTDTLHYVAQVKAIRAHLQQHGVPPR
jgi:N-acetylmuramoyl-L-alanine amidase